MSRRLVRLVVIAVVTVILVGCVGDSNPPNTATSTGTGGQPSAPASTAITSRSTPSPSATVPSPLEALLAPGPTYQAPPRIFFRYGDDLWALDSGQPAKALTRGVDLGPFAPAPDGSRVAVVVYSGSSTARQQEVRILGGGGETEAIAFGPEPAEPAILNIGWSWDGAWLALATDDGSLALIPAGPAVGSPSPLHEADGKQTAVRVEWAPNDAGLVWLADSDSGRSLIVTTRDGDSVTLSDAAGSPAHPVRSFSWLPGRGRIAYVEGSAAATGAPSSIFTTAPDGTSRELLVSAGRFGPVAYFEDLTASPDGRRLAFTVFMPDQDGSPAFASLWVLNIDTAELVQVAIPTGYRVTDLWWINIGLVWRGVDLAVPVGGSAIDYAGIEPFVLGIYSFDSDSSNIVFQSGEDRP